MASEWNEKVAQGFESRVDTYDQHSDVQSRIAQKLADELPDLDTPDILEIGCGTGALTRHLLSKYKNGSFHITDISPQMVEQARGRIGSSSVRWDVMDGENPELDRHYDLIVSNMAFQWFRDIDKALEKLRQLLRPDGVLLYTVPAPSCFEEWTSALSALSLPVGVLDFKTPSGVFRQEDVVVQYKSTLRFLQSLKGIGAATPRNGYSALCPTDLVKACRRADEISQGQITWNILYGRLKGETSGGL